MNEAPVIVLCLEKIDCRNQRNMAYFNILIFEERLKKKSFELLCLFFKVFMPGLNTQFFTFSMSLIVPQWF